MGHINYICIIENSLEIEYTVNLTRQRLGGHAWSGEKNKGREAYTYCQVQLGRINFREHAESDL